MAWHSFCLVPASPESLVIFPFLDCKQDARTIWLKAQSPEGWVTCGLGWQAPDLYLLADDTALPFLGPPVFPCEAFRPYVLLSQAPSLALLLVCFCVYHSDVSSSRVGLFSALFLFCYRPMSGKVPKCLLSDSWTAGRVGRDCTPRSCPYVTRGLFQCAPPGCSPA